MNCEKIKSQLSSYIDGELTEKENFFIQEHILVCPECSQEEESLRKTSGLLKSWENIPAPDSFCRVLLAKAEELPRQTQRSIINAVRPFAGPRASIKVAFYGAVVLLVCLLILVFTTSPLRVTPLVEPHPIYAETIQNVENKTVQDIENLPRYTTMAEIKVLGIWE
jgi:anti-sigma factor RsiW